MISLIMILDIIGAVSGVIGCLLIMYKKKSGYVTFGISNSAYLLLGSLQGFYGLVIVSAVMLIVDIVAYRKWARDESNRL